MDPMGSNSRVSRVGYVEPFRGLVVPTYNPEG